MLHLYQEIRVVSKTIPDAIVKNYLNWLLNALVISNINKKRDRLIKFNIIKKALTTLSIARALS